MPHPTPPTRLSLIGYRGTGKSTVGRLLAAGLGWECFDSDDEVERGAQRSIAELFAQEGEAGFRDREEQAVARLCQRDQTVLSLGGGAILRPATRERLAAAGPVVWLTATPETLFQRIGADETSGGRRPALTSVGGLEEIRRVLAERTPLYRACATLVVDTEGRHAGDVVRAILEATPGLAPSPGPRPDA